MYICDMRGVRACQDRVARSLLRNARKEMHLRLVSGVPLLRALTVVRLEMRSIGGFADSRDALETVRAIYALTFLMHGSVRRLRRDRISLAPARCV